jgi:hypothetical protein
MLRAALSDRGRAPFDPRPIAAVLAGELRATELVADLVGLVTSPHPIVAATARGAALRLGAGASRTGAIDEVEPFLWGDDADALRSWSAFAAGAEPSEARATIPLEDAPPGD